ncbi:hypothetical protein F8M41_022359 [Gigaspora margarita]|uniref:Uncharacterized protein n=1 Tax=Gigaspora margarita TaxID=4874 RepID=A0A8H4AF55_GIGMA|nr:hypothetical protein F8M41_022359 [Gigaspora margarita]
MLLQSKNNLQKLSSTGNFDTQPTISSGSEIDQLNRELENNQLQENQPPQQPNKSHEINQSNEAIFCTSHMSNSEVLMRMNDWEYAIRNDRCGELIDSFGYISNQNEFVKNLENNVYFSDKDLRMDSDVSNNSN